MWHCVRSERRATRTRVTCRHDASLANAEHTPVRVSLARRGALSRGGGFQRTLTINAQPSGPRVEREFYEPRDKALTRMSTAAFLTAFEQLPASAPSMQDGAAANARSQQQSLESDPAFESFHERLASDEAQLRDRQRGLRRVRPTKKRRLPASRQGNFLQKLDCLRPWKQVEIP